MIFDGNYDKVLWLLISSARNDSERIYELFNCIPEEVCVKIKKAIDNYYNGDMDNKIILKDTISNSDNFGCTIVVKVVLGKLHLNIYKWREEKERIEEEYELVLKDIDKQDFDEMLFFDKKYIGEYSSEINEIHFVGYGTNVETSNYNRKYYIKRIPFGYVIISSLGKKKLDRKFVNIKKKMPIDVNRDDLDNKESSVKKRIRLKK